MTRHSNKIKHKAKTTLNKVKTNIKETLFDIADIPSTSVKQLADFIQRHPDTKVTKKKMLGISYTFHSLETEGYHYYLETNKSKILQLDGHYQDKKIVSYRSYRDHYQLNTPIKMR
ncbi:hypothetical protein J7E52_11860 [Bacillus sp. ISL-34]|uniref:hypothetical protein n=1 Tax=Bacillus sp. ISL-34 TaxID=2819121 RepID=UPI001BE8D175|nr:hypothetical protein [Bacillus sp. ISL-34]MBT2647411.1 hypothetical protein [Bacillus sp. ISL-34]